MEVNREFFCYCGIPIGHPIHPFYFPRLSRVIFRSKRYYQLLFQCSCAVISAAKRMVQWIKSCAYSLKVRNWQEDGWAFTMIYMHRASGQCKCSRVIDCGTDSAQYGDAKPVGKIGEIKDLGAWVAFGKPCMHQILCCDVTGHMEGTGCSIFVPQELCLVSSFPMARGSCLSCGPGLCKDETLGLVYFWLFFLQFPVKQNTDLFSTFCPPSMHSSACHRRDISTFLDNLMI